MDILKSVNILGFTNLAQLIPLVPLIKSVKRNLQILHFLMITPESCSLMILEINLLL